VTAEVMTAGGVIRVEPHPTYKLLGSSEVLFKPSRYFELS